MVATAKDLRFNISQLFDVISKGEDVTITYRGNPRAKLIPIGKEKEKENDMFGMWADKDIDVNKSIRNTRENRKFDI